MSRTLSIALVIVFAAAPCLKPAEVEPTLISSPEDVGASDSDQGDVPTEEVARGQDADVRPDVPGEPPCAAPLPSTGSVGFNYAPAGHLPRWLADEYEFPEVQQAFSRDLPILASLGARIVRLVLLPYKLGMTIKAGRAPGDFDTALLDALTTNLPRAIERFAEYGMDVVVAIGANAFYWDGPEQGGTWWELTYGPDGWADFTADLVAWTGVVATAVESSPACSHVLYYDLHNEVDYNVDGMEALVQAQLSQIQLPARKRGISLLHAQRAEALALDLQASGATLDFVEFHTYPDRDHGVDIPALATTVRGHLPGVELLVGEFAGIYCENGQSEAEQAAVVSDVLDRTALANVRASLHWMLWDREPLSDCPEGAERTGLGFGPERPRDALGVWTARTSSVPNADLEDDVPSFFTGGTVEANVAFERVGPDPEGAVTGQHFARLTATAPGQFWVCTPRFAVGGSQLALSGYVRAPIPVLSVDVHSFGGNGMEIATDSFGLELDEASLGEIQQIQGRLAMPLLPLRDGAAEAHLCVVGNAPEGTAEKLPFVVEVDGIAVGWVR